MKKEGINEDEIKASFKQKIPMHVFAWNNTRGKDTFMTPYDSIKYTRQMMQAGFMAMDPNTGEVKAWVGGIDFKTFKYDHANINTKRQVGSTMKPLLYSLAIEEAGFTPNTTVEDQQQSFGTYGLVPATSKSCTGATITMAEALAKSRNCASAYIMKQLDGVGNNGAKRFVDYLKRCDLQTKIEPYPSIALGSCEISLFEMMQAYSMFPGRGMNAKPMYITRIEDRNGNVLESFSPKRKEVISEVTAYSIVKMMQGVVQFGTARGIWGYDLPGNLEIAGKTGTTNDNSDAWFMGYTPQILAGTWVGADDRFIRFNGENLNGQGARAAMPIWAYFYAKAAADPNCGLDPSQTFLKPENMSEINFDYFNGTTAPMIGEGEDQGNGTSTDYEVPKEIKAEEIRPESDINLEATKNSKLKESDLKPQIGPKSNDGKSPNQGNKPPEKGKAIMPPPVKKPGNGK
jgi:penicillin-binding protein 1A